MRTEFIETESSILVNFKRAMYALMVIVVAVAIPLLSYLELSYKVNANGQKKNVKVENIAGVKNNSNTIAI